MIRDFEDPFAEIRELFRNLVENSAIGPGSLTFRAVTVSGNQHREEPPDRTGIEVHRNGDEIILVTELPGFSGEQVTVGFEGGRCLIEASDGDRHCRKTALVPEPDLSSVRQTFRHGVFELVFRVKAEPVHQADQ
jgi:HSP20 family molecular chaperone IbpA